MLDAMRLGLAGGILGGLSMFVMTLLSLFTGYADSFLHMMSSVYPGFDISAMGSVIGLVYGFVDGFICLFVLGWLYNNVKVKL